VVAARISIEDGAFFKGASTSARQALRAGNTRTAEAGNKRECFDDGARSAIAARA